MDRQNQQQTAPVGRVPNTTDVNAGRQGSGPNSGPPSTSSTSAPQRLQGRFPQPPQIRPGFSKPPGPGSLPQADTIARRPFATGARPTFPRPPPPQPQHGQTPSARPFPASGLSASSSHPGPGNGIQEVDLRGPTQPVIRGLTQAAIRGLTQPVIHGPAQTVVAGPTQPSSQGMQGRSIAPIRIRPNAMESPLRPSMPAGGPRGILPVGSANLGDQGPPRPNYPPAQPSRQTPSHPPEPPQSNATQASGMSSYGRPPAITGQATGPPGSALLRGPFRSMPPGSGPQLRGPNLQHGGQPPGNANPAGARPPFGPRGFPGQAPPFAPQPQPGPQSSYSARPVQMPQPQQQFNRRPDSDEKINPSAMPRPRPRPDAPVIWKSRVEGRPQLPLPAEWPVIIEDAGNCSPRNMRLTFSSLPATSDLLKQAKMPFAVLIQPLSPTHPEEQALQVVDMGPGGPLRCSKCRAYMNPFMQFHTYGKAFTCNFCSAVTQTPLDYIENIGPDGRRRDALERPELSKGSVEFVAPEEFQVRQPMPPVYFFLIDVSHTAVTTGVTTAACACIQRVLDDIQGEERAQIGFATFDNQIQFYALREGQSQPQMLVIPDADEPYCPLPQSLLSPLASCRTLAKGLLDQIPRIYAGTNHLDGCATAAIQACILALKGGVGGKLHVFLSCLSKVGSNALTVRDTGSNQSEKEPMKTMLPASTEYRKIGEQAAERMNYVDVATLGVLTYVTSGQLYLYQPFKQDTHGDEFFNDLRWNIVRPQGWEAVGRLRMSEGLVAERYLGAHYRRTQTDVDMPAVNSDSSLAVELRHSERLAENKEAYLQFALLYTNCEGQRRIRVHTLGVHVSSLMSTIFRGADLDSQVNYMARSLAYQLPGAKLESLKQQIYKQTVDPLFTYRDKVAKTAASGQLILPESLKLLPLYSLALIKTYAFRTRTRADIRAAYILRLLSLPPERTLPLIYPRLFALGILLAELPRDANISELELPESINRLSAAKLAEDGIFLLENGYEAYVQFGSRVPSELMMALLGLPTLEVGGQQLYSLPEFDTHQSRALHALMDIIRRQRGRFIPLQVVPHLPHLMSPFYSSLVEDKVEGESYMDHLRAIHRSITEKLK